MYLVIRCDCTPGRLHELDEFLDKVAVPFFKAQEGVGTVCIYEDALLGWPERTLMIEVSSLEDLERILQSAAWRKHREDFFSYASSVSSQIQNCRLCA
jgi:hypothetical protein